MMPPRAAFSRRGAECLGRDTRARARAGPAARRDLPRAPDLVIPRQRKSPGQIARIFVEGRNSTLHRSPANRSFGRDDAAASNPGADLQDGSGHFLPPASVRSDDRVMRDRALLLSLASLAIWIGWELLRGPHHPYGDLSNGHYTDHFSHLNAARLLPRAGLDIWRKPLTQLLRPLTHEERARLPADVKAAAYPAGEAYFVPGWPADKPLIASLAFNPPFYPPGDALLFAPVALLYHFTQLSFAGANLLALLLLLVYAHVSLYFALRATEEEPLRLFTLLIVYFPLVHWTLEGFYDAAILAPLIFCAQQLARGRGIGAILAFCCAAAMHFRAFFFAPWACAALALVLRERQWRSWGARGFAMAAAAGALAIAALVPFALLQPALRALGTSNVLALSVAPALRPQVLGVT